MLVVALIVGVAKSRSDTTTPPPSLPSSAPAEPITGSADPVQAMGTPAHDPFTPSPIGPAPGDKSPKPFWSYEDVSPAQKAVIDRGRDTTGAQASLDVYAAAAAERAKQAAADAALNQLGVGNVASVGVVP